jgi:carboxyl-terminal processing protease
LKSEKEIKSVILDLRGNPGGLLDIAVDISDKFLDKELLIVSTKGRSPASLKEYFSTQEPMIGDSKLVVLINGGSASASEIVAGAIQDNDRGVIIGSRSFGKGLVQTINPLSYNTSLKITTAKYYTPSGRSIQKIDYSDNSDVIADSDSIISGEFLTGNKRVVYSKGGILPDSTVEYYVEGKITRELLAHGIIFKFATNFFYKNQDADFSEINNEKLFEEFKQFAHDQKFEYKSDAETHLSLLIEDIEEKYVSFTEELTDLKTRVSELKKKDFELFEVEILNEIKEELAVRYYGMEGRIKEHLKNDIQFQVALNVLNDSKLYKNLLNVN